MTDRAIYLYWLVTNLLLAAGLFFWPPALYLAMTVTLTHGAHFWLRSPQITSFPMQVRIGYLGLLILGQAPFFGWVNWVQLAGTTALLTTGYCPLARILCLMPWNRDRALSWKLFATAIFSPPVDGSILQVISTD